MVKFKIYNKKLKKFVSQDASDTVWKIRHNLGIWNNNVNDNSVNEMYKKMKKNDKNLELYVKIDGRFKPVTKEVIDTVIKEYKKKEPERKEYRKNWKEFHIKIRENSLKRHVKVCQKKLKTYKLPDDKWRIRRCQKIIKINKTKKQSSMMQNF
jgi:hypothetical protein